MAQVLPYRCRFSKCYCFFFSPNVSFANKPNATMIKTPPMYVAIDGLKPNTTQSASATKNTLNLKQSAW